MKHEWTQPTPHDAASGNLLERVIFQNRIWIIGICVLLTLLLGSQLGGLQVSASFERMMPQSHPFVQNYLANEKELRGLGNTVRVVVEADRGDIFNANYLGTLAKINDEIFLLPGVDRSWMKSLWTPVVRWAEATEEGFIGDQVIPSTYKGTPESIQEVRRNVMRAGLVGGLVASDLKSSMIVVPLLATDAEGHPIDYQALSSALEKIRTKYASADAGGQAVKIHIIGFAKLTGDLIEGLGKVIIFFVVSALIASVIIYFYTRCLRSTMVVIGCSLVAVVWLGGILALLGRAIDPYSVLVPFLVFAIGVSHGAQKMNGIMQDVGRGAHKLTAARLTFRRLFLAGVTALGADAVGFAVLMVIDIPVIRDLALMASLGVAILVFTNLILLPILLSYVGVSENAAARTLAESAGTGGTGLGRIWLLLDRFTQRRWALAALATAAVLGVIGFHGSQALQIGDLDAGAPELRRDSRYNQDDAFITSHYAVSSDVFAVMVKTANDGCRSYDTLLEADRLASELARVPGVQRATSLADTMRIYNAGYFEGNPKWMTLPDNQVLIDPLVDSAGNWNSELLNRECSLTPVLAFLSDHKAATLERVVAVAERFAKEHSTPDRQFLLAAGNAGIDAATNIVVKDSNRLILLYVYAAVIVLSFITFRSWRAVVVAVVPLALTSILAEALMAALGIGVKVSTLPVIALGVGIGIDYALYLLSVQLAAQRAGLPLQQAYRQAVAFTGKVVAVVGVTLALGVVTWVWSPIKFQADMGLLLTFMLLWNMVGALVLIPALSHFLLNRSAGIRADESIPARDPTQAIARRLDSHVAKAAVAE